MSIQTAPTSLAGLPERHCDECGRSIVKAQKVYRGKSICSTCYARLFKPRPCSKCTKTMRAYIGEQNPVCGSCDRAMRTCLRCEKPTPRAGMMVSDKAVCNACAPYFRKPGICARCDSPSSRLSRITGISAEPVCEKCWRDLTGATCTHCHRHRRIYAMNADGRALCKSCSETPGISHLCPTCGHNVPGAGKAVCHACSIRLTFQRKAEVLGAQYRNEHLKEIWLGFADWIIQDGKTLPLLRKLQSYASTLSKIEPYLGAWEHVSNQHLALALTADDLRRSSLLAKYLCQKSILTSNNFERAEWSDRKRILSALTDVSAKPWGKDIADYAAYLASGERQLTVRTQRVYVRAAIALMEFSRVASISALDNKMLVMFIRRYPGHRASLAAWLRFLKERRHHVFDLPQKKLKQTKATQKLIAQVKALLKMSEAPKTNKATILAKLLSVLFSIPFEHLVRSNRPPPLLAAKKLSYKD